MSRRRQPNYHRGATVRLCSCPTSAHMGETVELVLRRRLFRHSNHARFVARAWSANRFRPPCRAFRANATSLAAVDPVQFRVGQFSVIVEKCLDFLSAEYRHVLLFNSTISKLTGVLIPSLSTTRISVLKFQQSRGCDARRRRDWLLRDLHCRACKFGAYSERMLGLPEGQHAIRPVGTKVHRLFGSRERKRRRCGERRAQPRSGRRNDPRRIPGSASSRNAGARVWPSSLPARCAPTLDQRHFCAHNQPRRTRAPS